MEEFCNFQNQRVQRKKVVLLLIGHPSEGDRVKREAPMMFLLNRRSKLKYYRIRLPKVGRAENLNPQEAIPPFSLIVDSIQARKLETLV